MAHPKCSAEEIDLTGEDDDAEGNAELQQAIELSLLEQRSQDATLENDPYSVEYCAIDAYTHDYNPTFSAKGPWADPWRMALEASLDTALAERSQKKHKLCNSPTSIPTRQLPAVPCTPKSSPQHHENYATDATEADNDSGRPCLPKRVCLDRVDAAPAYESEESALTCSILERHAAPSPLQHVQEPVPCTSGHGQCWGSFGIKAGSAMQSAGSAMHLRRFYRRQRVLWRCNGDVYEAIVTDIDGRSCPLLYTLDVVSPGAPNKTVESTAHDLLLYLEPGERVWCRLREPAGVVERDEETGDVLGTAADRRTEAVAAASTAEDAGDITQPHAGRCGSGAAASARMCLWEEATVHSTDLSQPDPEVCVVTPAALDLTPWNGRLPLPVLAAMEIWKGGSVLLWVPMSDVELWRGVGESSGSTQCPPPGLPSD